MTSKAVTRVGDKTVGHGLYKPRSTLDSVGAPDSNVGGSDNVFANNKGVNRVGDRWKPHTPNPNDQHANDTDASGPDLTIEPSPSTEVYANQKRVARVGDKADKEGDTIAGGSPNVFIGDNAEFESFTVPEVAFVVEQADVDFVTPSNVSAKSSQSSGAISTGVSGGIVSPSSSLLAPTSVGAVDNTPPPAYAPSTSVLGDFNSYNQDNIPYDTLMLTDKTSLAEFTTRAALWKNQPKPFGPNTPYTSDNRDGGDNKHIKAQYGLTVPQILNNLANLAKNIYEPIKARYPRVIVTNTFRQAPPGGSAEQAQHGRGQAMDLVFPGLSTNQYYDVAVWIRDNLPFDQLLQEKAGSKIWIHVSHYSGTGQQVPKASKVANLIVGRPTQFIPGLSPLA
jgi:uncharacterized Zn-binding protein involved in type VI secretion